MHRQRSARETISAKKMHKRERRRHYSLHTTATEKQRKRVLGGGSLMLVTLYLAFCLLSCTDSIHYSNDPTHRLRFGCDTVAFDTMFTAVGSSTGVFVVYNPNNEALSLPDVRLACGNASPFRVNLDGEYNTAWHDVELRALDSLYVFVEVTIGPREEDLPFEVRDSLVFTLASGIQQHVLLTAWGRDAYILDAVTLTDSLTILPATRPIFVSDSLVVAEGATLRLSPGCTLHFHADAGLSVYGTIEALGTKDSLVVFRGDRFDRMFSYLPYDWVKDQWQGITLHSCSHDNLFQYADIHGSTYGIRSEATDMEHILFTMENSQIHNIGGTGLDLMLSVGSAINCQFSNAAPHCIKICGGRYEFIHCTIANLWPWSANKEEALYLCNTDETHFWPLLGVNFTNCIVTGWGDDELAGLVIDTLDDYHFSHCLINSCPDRSTHFNDIVWESPDSAVWGKGNFVEHSISFYYDFHLDSLSRARCIGDPAVLPLVPYDRDGELRPTPPDAGCYQYKEE